ncbi:MAG: hypothetical protein CML04_03335 [Pseudozobellia sp.]|nr:hypothetical protein [Pseudozobellia sp.]MBG49178.1 hypothetical protein [Pseudozobellia sp.]|tara:strand:- start:3052 stop:3990 length:939 start_codon:yes stop_codon:yes gene_type:complete
MISIIFGKTKPINYIIVLSFLFVFYWSVHFALFNKFYAAEELVGQVLILALLLFSIFVVNFIVKRNKITGTNSFPLMYYALLTVIFPETLADSNAIFSSFFLLLASRRLLSMRSLKNIKFKIFDSTLWILVSTLFYDWAILFLLLVFAAIYFYQPKIKKNWLVPFAAGFTFFMITECVLVLANSQDFLANHYQFKFYPNMVYFSYWGHSTKLICYVLGTFLAGLIAFLKLGKGSVGQVVTMRLIALSFIIGIVLNVLKLSDNVYPIMVTFFPAVVFFTKYIESIRRPNIKEIILMVSIALPFLVFASSMALK